jgi:uncharacterized protein (TIGR01777 family)
MSGSRPLTVGVSGASGLVGRAVVDELARAGHRVVRFVRRPVVVGAPEIAWAALAAGETAPLAGLDAIVHLAGENVGAGRWTPARKQAILESRVEGTGLFARALSGHPAGRRLIVASAVGYYGDTGDRLVTEADGPGSGFLADVCRAWEASAAPAAAAGHRVTFARLGVVLATGGGALARMRTPFRLGLGGPLGDGRQFMSWIHLHDAVRALRFLVEQGGDGAYNVTAPEPVTQGEFARALGAALHRPAVLPAPRFALEALLGEMAREMLLAGARVVPRRLLDEGFRFSWPTVSAALRECLGRTEAGEAA